MNYESGVTYDSDTAVDGESPQGSLPPQRSKMTWIALGVFALLALIAGGFVLWNYLAPAEEETDDSSQAQFVTVVSPQATTIEGTITATGTLSARRDMPVGVAGEGGRVVSVPVDAGDWVRAGQVLAVIDRSVQQQQASSASAQLEVARADARLAQSNLDRALKLVERGFISTADIERLTATRDAADARVRVSQASLAELRARNARLNVVAPSSGLILERHVEPGQIVSGGSGALFRMARDGEMEMKAQVGETELAQLSVGVTAHIVPSGTDKSFEGQVWQISPIIDQTNRQGVVRIALPRSRDLRPGGFATATISSGTIVAPVLPESAIQTDDNGSFVFVIDGEDKVQRKAIKTGLVTSQGIAIADGIESTDRIVLRAGGFLRAGETVRPRSPESDKS